MDPTKVDKKLVLLALAVLGPKVKQLTGYELTVDDAYSLLAAAVVLWHAVEVWGARREARSESGPAQTETTPIRAQGAVPGYTPIASTAEPDPPPKAP